MILNRLNYLLILLLAGITACQNESTESTFSDCRYQAPEAIFSNSVPDISHHYFELKGGIGLEKVLIEEHLSLTLIQEGCDQITQEFEFSWAGNFNHAPDHFWVEQAADKFYRLGQLGATYLTFHSIAKAIENLSNEINIHTPFELQPGVFLSIEPAPEKSRAILLITLSERI
jgi:hypothetical protein